MIIARSKRSREIFEMPPITEQMPFVFPVTGFKLLELSGECSLCNCKMHPKSFRGRLQLAFPTVAHLEACGLCAQCQVLSRFEYRIHDDGAISGLKDGKWRRWENVGGQSSTRPAQSKCRASYAQLAAAAAFMPFYMVYRWSGWLFGRIFGPSGK